MKLTVKASALTTIFIFVTIISQSQLKFPTPNGIAPDIKKVIQDYPNNFHNLIGSMLSKNTQTTDYACNCKVSGAESVMLTKYSSEKKKEVISWQAVLLTTDDFEDAKKKFRSYFNQLHNLAVRMEEGLYYHLIGHYEQPAEERKFNSVLFSIDEGNSVLRKLKVELQMIYEPMEWKLKVLVFEKQKDDDEAFSAQE